MPRVCFVLIAFLSASGRAAAQPAAAETAVHVTVRDPTELPIRGALIVITGAADAAVTVSTNERGEATVPILVPGVYSGMVESSGFERRPIDPFTIRRGERISYQITLQVARIVESIDVAPAPAEAASLNAFATELTAEQLAALPEDPEELAEVLQQLVGADADIRVNGFRGGRLPPGTDIEEVRIRYDIGATSSGGGPRVEIRSTPGGNRLRNNASFGIRGSGLDGRDALSGKRTAGLTRQYAWNVNTPLVRNRTGLTVSVEAARTLEAATIHAATAEGTYSDLVEQPSSRMGVWTRLEHRVGSSQAIRVEFGSAVTDAHNQGIGQFDLPERAFTREGSEGEVRVAHHATALSDVESDLSAAFAWDAGEVSSANDARTIRVLDAFTGGGAQQRGGERSRRFELQQEVQFKVRRLHQVTSGVEISGATYAGDETTNAAGTYTFVDLASFNAGRPATFTQRIGDARYSYSMYRFGWHVEDDVHVARNLMLNLGIRHDFQSHIRDWVNFSPRIGTSWKPFSAGTTLRASVDVTHALIDDAMYRETLLVDGVRQRDLVISDPGYPDPFAAGIRDAAAAPSVVRVSRELDTPFLRRYTIGVDQPIGKNFRFRGTFAHQSGHRMLRSRNANQPMSGIRPDATLLNVVELESTAHSASDSVQTELSVSYPRRRLSANVGYVLGRAMDESDGAFSLPPDSFNLAGEWGPARSDVRHRVTAAVSSDLPANFRVNAGFRAQSASPYTITTGIDANGDGVYSERPPAVGRNSARGAGMKNLDVTLTWALGVGQRQPPASSRTRPGTARENATLRFELFARTTNVLNLVNLQNFSGVLASPFFGRPTAAGTPRRVVLGTRVWF